MKINNVCLLIPIHPPHYHYMYNLINKLQSNNIDIDIFLIFSSESDYEIFTMKGYIKPIIVDEPINLNSIITMKKFHGLQKMINEENEFIICIDSEIDIIPENVSSENISKKITQIFSNKKLYAGKNGSNLTRGVNESSARLFKNDFERLKSLTSDFTLYSWWSDLPVYRKSDLPDFFEVIKYNENKYKLEWGQFDYVIYQYYLVLKYNFEIINTTPITNLDWSLELLKNENHNILNSLLSIGYGYSWINKELYVSNKDFVESHGGFLIYHLDRYN